MKWLQTAAIVLLTSTAVSAQTFVRLQPLVKPGTISVNGGAVTITQAEVVGMGGIGSAKIQTLDTYSGTWEVQCSLDGTTFDADNELKLSLTDSTTTVFSVTDEVGIWEIQNVAACRAIRVIATAGFAATDVGIVLSAVQSGGGGGGGAASGGGLTDTELRATAVPVTCGDCSGSGVSHIDGAAFNDDTDDVVPMAGLFADTSTVIAEDEAGLVRMSTNRVLYGMIRDGAGNERGANVDASNQLAIAGPVTNAGTFAVQSVEGAGALLTSSQLIDDAVSGAGFNITQLGGAAIPMTTTQANDLANTLDGLNTTSFLMGFDGTTWDRLLATAGVLQVGDGSGAFNVICDSGCSGGSQYTEDAPAAADPVGNAQIVVRADTPASIAADGDNVALRGSAYGAAYVTLLSGAGAVLTPSADMTIGTAVGTTGPGSLGSYKEFDGAALPTTANVNTEEEAAPFAVSLQGVQYVMVVSEDGALERGTSATPYVAAVTEQAGSLLTAAVDTETAVDGIEALLGTTNTALAIIDNAETAASHYAYTSAGATEDEHVVAAAPAVLWSVTATNTAATVAYLRCENQDEVGDGAPGTDTLAAATDIDLAIPGQTIGAGITFSFARGLAFTTGIKCWLTTGEAYSSVAEVGVDDVKLLYSYK